jgi:hypothetical protein
MFKALVLRALYTLCDDQAKYQIRDRLSFMSFVGLALRRLAEARAVIERRLRLVYKAPATTVVSGPPLPTFSMV